MHLLFTGNLNLKKLVYIYYATTNKSYFFSVPKNYDNHVVDNSHERRNKKKKKTGRISSFTSPNPSKRVNQPHASHIPQPAASPKPAENHTASHLLQQTANLVFSPLPIGEKKLSKKRSPCYIYTRTPSIRQSRAADSSRARD